MSESELKHPTTRACVYSGQLRLMNYSVMQLNQLSNRIYSFDSVFLVFLLWQFATKCFYSYFQKTMGLYIRRMWRRENNKKIYIYLVEWKLMKSYLSFFSRMPHQTKLCANMNNFPHIFTKNTIFPCFHVSHLFFYNFQHCCCVRRLGHPTHIFWFPRPKEGLHPPSETKHKKKREKKLCNLMEIHPEWYLLAHTNFQLCFISYKLQAPTRHHSAR